MAVEFTIKDARKKPEPTRVVEFSLKMTEDGDVDILAEDYFLGRIDVTSGKLVLYSGVAADLGLNLNEDGQITVDVENE